MGKIIDLSYLNEISGGDQGFIREMLELFVNSTATEAPLFKELLDKGDYAGIGHLAHKMKAPIQMLGANNLFLLIRDLELFGKEASHTDKIPGMVEEVNNQVNLACEEINQILAGTME
ncbi:MAG: Hpt domain-containing protein [Bacteroidetes bacterium]|nr:Hpt domain-containing protein [Bacteroidota bacterium]MCK6610822.1 Hpt domain-containing protein [Bacteroidia bacterium]